MYNVAGVGLFDLALSQVREGLFLKSARCLRCGYVGPVYSRGVLTRFCPRCDSTKLDFKHLTIIPHKNIFVWLKHQLGFHSGCSVPCSHPRLEEAFTCRITLKEFSKEGRWKRLKLWLRSFRKK